MADNNAMTANNVLQFRKISGLPEAEPVTGLELLEIVQGGASRRIYLADLIGFDTYDLAVELSEGVIELADSQVFRISNTVNRVINLSITNQPADRALTIVLVIEGKAGTINWPGNIVWNAGAAPELGTNVSNVIIFWDGVRFTGTTGAVN